MKLWGLYMRRSDGQYVLREAYESEEDARDSWEIHYQLGNHADDYLVVLGPFVLE